MDEVTPQPATHEAAFALIESWLTVLPMWGYTYGKLGSFTAVVYKERVVSELSAVRYCWMPVDSHMSPAAGPVVSWLLQHFHALYREEMTRQILLNADVEVLG